jgi:DNA-binding LacI/PurR family transcriptional regulator
VHPLDRSFHGVHHAVIILFSASRAGGYTYVFTCPSLQVDARLWREGNALRPHRRPTDLSLLRPAGTILPDTPDPTDPSGSRHKAARRATSFDIAALAGVSQPTVSRALSGSRSVSEETRARVLAAAQSLHYTVDRNASGLRRRQSQTLALLFFEDETPDDTLINPFYLSMLGALTRAAASAGYDLLISLQQLSGSWFADYEDSRKADGVLLLGYGDYRETRPHLEALVAHGTHFVRWGAAKAGQIGITVGSDNREGGRLATHHLLSRGRRRIAFLGTAGAAAPEMLERYQGHVAALAEAGLDADPQLAVDSGPSEAQGRRALAILQSRGAAFDAIFAASDMAAIGAMRALQEQGIAVPGDVAVVGFDDLAAARMTDPPLTSIHQDARRAGETLVETLIAAIDERAPQSVVLPVQLMVRGSS